MASSAEKISNPRSSNKAAILEAASRLFIDGGVNALSVRAIAKAAGVSTIGIYSHFESKQGILDTLYIEGFELVANALDSIDSSQSTKEILRQGALNYLAVAKNNKAHYRLIFGQRQPGYEPSQPARDIAALTFNKLTDWIGLVLPEQPTRKQRNLAAVQLWSFLHGTASLMDHDVSQLVDRGNWEKNVLSMLESFHAGLVEQILKA